ncbi:hypothetical protein [Clostridium brassicae]|uniref:Uncharacterized protein n=1 Tax=Clostridium brassicae TaxID=2999072 RepID=A0ABT4D7L9_9CLOT|nr:hypothetical protein [Clostridium brassicae]MCY6958292.1 hypothetical protein [Clostridium brassicae]
MEKVVIYNIDFTEAGLGYTAVWSWCREQYTNRIILDSTKMAEIILQNKDKLDDVEDEKDAYAYISEMQTQYWFEDNYILKHDYMPIGY